MKAIQNLVVFVLGVKKEVGIENFVKRMLVAYVNLLVTSLKGSPKPNQYGHKQYLGKRLWVLTWRGFLGSEKEDSLLEFQFRNLSRHPLL